VTGSVAGPVENPGDSTDEAAEHLGNEVQRVGGRFRTFLGDHGGSGSAVVQYLGRPGFRIVVVAADGTFADAVVSDRARADAVCEAAGVEVQDWSRELTSRVTISAADRRRMAGSGR
jgi:hypothetical protein